MTEQPSTTLARILLVDDEPDVLSLYSIKLSRSGFEVITATNGVDAITLAQKELPDIILMDMKMPVMDGVTAQHQLRENPVTASIPVLFITAFSDPTAPSILGDYHKDSNVLGFIKKGIALDDLVREVTSYIPKKNQV